MSEPLNIADTVMLVDDEPDWHHRCDIAACNCGRCHQCGEVVPEPEPTPPGVRVTAP